MERLKPIWEKIVRFWKRMHFTQIILLLGLSFILFTIIYFAVLASQANVESLKAGLSQSTVIYDKDEEVASEITTNRTSGVEVDEIPEHVRNAVVAIEDHRFYEHNGFDVKGIVRVFFKNLLAGRITGGGSTITQQLAKNALLSPEKTYRRKIEELFLAVELEKTYKKDEILQMYLNQSYFGSGAWGIGQASKKYFNKDIQNVSISEAALLAGLLQSPSARDPYKHLDRAIERRNVVLSRMLENKLISEAEYEAAKKEEVHLEDGGGSFIKRDYPFYVDAVLDEAIGKYGLTQEEILTRGYQIYTNMDQNIQTALEKVYAKDSVFPRGRGGEIVQSGAVMLDPHSGGVLGLVGGRGEYVFRGFNRATHLQAQPGSTLKPLAVYTPAIEEGYLVTSILQDEQKTYGKYAPTNPNGVYKGDVPMYEAVEDSLNASTVWLLNEIGLEKGLDSLKRFGIPLTDEDKYLGIALGGMHKGISPLRLAEAYSTFANEGKRPDGHLITKIVGPTGNVIAEHKGKSTRVTSKSVVREMNSMLLNVVESGTGTAAKISGVEIAGKTGSTQLPYEDINGSKDQWFVGYTPNIVGAVWLGYDKTDREHYLSNSSSENVVPIFRAIMEQSLPYFEPGEFDVVSVNSRLAGVNKKEESASKESKEITKTLKEKTDELKEVIKEESPKWKRAVEEFKEDAIWLYDYVKEKIGK
ncbi:PBP1A family penicillin-binding protein [Robertmurraya sp. DFI.2.37]|uniref:transglycosylase domain-containing protein n=1 Tax=Robertmurraya sp. DFI.2.37 TaxID=3031819 RepID=UPI001247FCE4|nr:PBP1A family penicillin-binding protein [Robertmurraya sp. DFI.2.37]MDF1507878.1 PBP1A family penicillin-binding protein [Robertmurraya sp. DFI.2.37]